MHNGIFGKEEEGKSLVQADCNSLVHTEYTKLCNGIKQYSNLRVLTFPATYGIIERLGIGMH